MVKYGEYPGKAMYCLSGLLLCEVIVINLYLHPVCSANAVTNALETHEGFIHLGSCVTYTQLAVISPVNSYNLNHLVAKRRGVTH